MAGNRIGNLGMTTSRIFLAVLLGLLAGASFADATMDFEQLLEEQWEWQLKSSPVRASMLGDRRYNDRWTDQSLKAIERRNNASKEFLSRVYAINKKE